MKTLQLTKKVKIMLGKPTKELKGWKYSNVETQYIKIFCIASALLNTTILISINKL